MSLRTSLSGGYRLVRRYMLKTYWVDTRLRLEGGRRTADGGRRSGSIQLPAVADLAEAEAGVPVLRPVVLHREDVEQVVAVAQGGGDRGLDGGAGQAAGAEAVERRDLVDLGDAVA